MKNPEFYKGREQTYVKHFFLEKYLERVAYNILSFSNEFVFVDGFSGPWKTSGEDFEDTSFMIAIHQLRKVREGVEQRKKERIRIRCFFNDKDPVAFASLQKAARGISDLEIAVVSKPFEEAVSDIVKFAGHSFSLTFIDPTGWSGYALDRIRPLLSLKGEVIINFMFDHLNRFLEGPRPEIAATFNSLFGDDIWFSEFETLVSSGESREDAILITYMKRLKKAGRFAHVTSTRILKPLSDRTYFHLVYGTKNFKGLREFRGVEKKAIREQENIRTDAKARSAPEDAAQIALFDLPGGQTIDHVHSFKLERSKQTYHAKRQLEEALRERSPVRYDDVLKVLLERPLIWESDVKSWIAEMQGAGKIEIVGLTGRQRVPKDGNLIRWLIG